MVRVHGNDALDSLRSQLSTRGNSGDYSSYVKSLHVRAHQSTHMFIAGRFDAESIREELCEIDR